MFLDALERGEQKSNNDMYGIHKISEDYTISLFLTDYFTYNCIVSIYKKLRILLPDNNPLIVKNINDIERISPFVCGCGCGGFISLKVDSVEACFVSHRSATVACPLHWHSSFDETLDPRDKTFNQGALPSIKVCIARGVKEELGICLDIETYYINSVILLMVQNAQRCELGIMSYIVCKLNKRKDIDRIINNLFSASDSENENQTIYLIPEADISKFYKKKQNQGEPLTMECFRMWKIFKYIKGKQGSLETFVDTLFMTNTTLNK